MAGEAPISTDIRCGLWECRVKMLKNCIVEQKLWEILPDVDRCCPRLAMLAITAYALEEFVTKAAVTINTPFLFNSAL